MRINSFKIRPQSILAPFAQPDRVEVSTSIAWAPVINKSDNVKDNHKTRDIPDEVPKQSPTQMMDEPILGRMVAETELSEISEKVKFTQAITQASIEPSPIISSDSIGFDLALSLVKKNQKSKL